MKSENEIFSTTGLSARDQITEWCKDLKKTVGNSIHGTLLDWWITPPNTHVDKQQITLAIKKADGVVWGISIPDTIYMRDRVERSQPGDSIGLRYEGDKDTGKMQPAKIIKFYNPDAEARHEKGETKITTAKVDAKSAVSQDVDSDDEPF